MGTDWLSRDLWRAHLSWLTPGWVDRCEGGRGDFDAARWMDQLQSAGYRALIFYTKFHDGQCTYHSRLSDRCTDRDFFGECTREARRRDMRVAAYFSSVLDQHIGSRHPDWQVAARDGQPARSWASARWPQAYCCINNPGYRAYLLGQVREICEGYRPDALWLDVFEPLSTDICHCPACRERHARERGSRQVFDPHGSGWYLDCHAELLAQTRALVKGIDPDCAIGQNTGARHPEYDPHDDFFTREAFTAPAISLYCRSMRPLGKPFETTSRLYTSVHSWAMRSPDRVLLESLASVVHGGACCMELSPTPTGTIMNEAVNRVAEAGRYLRALEPFLLDTTPVYEAGVYQADHLCGGPWGTTTPPGGWTSALLERDVTHALLYRGTDISRFRLVILDEPAIVDEVLARRLAAFVEAGGSLIVETSAAFPEAGGGLLRQVLGIEALGTTDPAAHYLAGLDPRLCEGMGEDELIVEGAAHRVAVTTAVPLAFLRNERASRLGMRDLYRNLPPAPRRSDDPAITLNRFGKGTALFLAVPLATGEIRNHRNDPGQAREYPTQLAANLARLALGATFLRGTTPAGVEAVVNRQEGRTIVHLLDHYVTGQYFDSRRDVLKLADVPVSVNEALSGAILRAWRWRGGEPEQLEISREGAWAEVLVEKLGVHEMVVLEHNPGS